jgi:hypothetical protein
MNNVEWRLHIKEFSSLLKITSSYNIRSVTPVLRAIWTDASVEAIKVQLKKDV